MTTSIPYSYSGSGTVSVDLSPTGPYATAIAGSKGTDGSSWVKSTTPPPPPPPSGVPVPPALQSVYKSVIWSDEFTGTALDTTKWETTVWYASPNSAGDISDENGGVSDPTKVTVANSILTLAAASSTPTNPQSWKCGYVDTAPHYSTPAGGKYYVEVRAQCPKAAPGLWPAICLYEDGDLHSGLVYAEMDLLEQVTTPGNPGDYAYQSWHPASGSGASRQIGSGFGLDLTGWHTFGASVDASGNIQYWFDANPTGAVIAGGSNALEPMFINLVMSTGGTASDGWAGVPTAATPSPVQFNVDYVRVFA